MAKGGVSSHPGAFPRPRLRGRTAPCTLEDLTMSNHRRPARVALAALAGATALALTPAGSAAQAQDHTAHQVPAGHAGAPGAQQHAAMSDAEREELQRQASAALAAVLAHADYDAISEHLTALIRANADEIGGDSDALVAHVSDVVHHMGEAAQADPQGMADHVMQALMQLHASQPQASAH